MLSFITANYVARALNYRGPSEWMPNQDATIAGASPEAFLEIAREIAAAGFEAIDIWSGHCHWQRHDRDDYLEQVKGFCSQFDLTITSYAGGLEARAPSEVEAVFKFTKQLGAPLFAGGIHGLAPEALCPVVNDLCGRYNLRWAFENHAEKDVEQMMSRIDGGRHERIGIALDTGWCGTHQMDAVDAARRLHRAGKLLIVHLKDVKAPGGHDSCAIGEGVVDCEGVVRYLVASNWNGAICLEHEPFDRDPMPEIIRSLERVKRWLS